MKKTIFAISVFSLLFASCNVEIDTVPVEDQNDDLVEFSINATLDRELTKTAYDSEGKMTWVDGDTCALIVYQGTDYTQQNRYQFMLEAKYGDITEEGRHATFYGLIGKHQATTDWLSTSFAVYPASVSQINSGNYYKLPFIKMPYNVSGEASSIILVGTPDNDSPAETTDFLFKTAMAVLKVNISKIPAAATAIRLTTSNSDSYPVDGDFTLVNTDGVVTVGFDNYQGWGEGYQNVNISDEGDIESRDFYFNVPAGTYPANTLSIEIRDANQVLMKKTIAKEITLSRNDCLNIPSLLYHRVYVNGSLSAPGLYTVKPNGANTIRAHISTEKLTSASYLADKANWVNGNRFGNATTAGFNLANLKNSSSVPFLSAKGTYYLQYIVSSDGSIPASLSDATVMAYGSVPFTYIPAANKIPVAASWLNVPCVSTAEGSVANLVDGNDGTYWHSPYGSENPARNATYGQIISVDLNEGSLTTDGNFYFNFCTRQVINNHAKAMNIYVSNVRWDDEGFEAGKVLVGSTTNALAGIYPYADKWIAAPIECSGSGSYRYITVSILQDSNGNDLRTSGCTHMTEIEFYPR